MHELVNLLIDLVCGACQFCLRTYMHAWGRQYVQQKYMPRLYVASATTDIQISIRTPAHMMDWSIYFWGLDVHSKVSRLVQDKLKLLHQALVESNKDQAGRIAVDIPGRLWLASLIVVGSWYNAAPWPVWRKDPASKSKKRRYITKAIILLIDDTKVHWD